MHVLFPSLPHPPTNISFRTLRLVLGFNPASTSVILYQPQELLNFKQKILVTALTKQKQRKDSSY